MRVVPAQEILDKIERGEPVEYDHVIVKGDLDLSKLDLPKRRVKRDSYEIWRGCSENVTVVLSPIRINDSTINGIVYFNNTILSVIDFSSTLFKSFACFDCSSFNDTTQFCDSSFDGIAYFYCSSFNNSANFYNSSFNNVTDFSHSSFHDIAYFFYSSFRDTTDFEYSSFNDLAYFFHSSFSGTAFFGHSSFNGTTEFSDSLFNDMAFFWYSSFNVSDFSSSQFNKQVSFDDCLFNGFISFNSSRFREDASFEGADFNGILYLNRAKYDKLYISWKNIKELGYDDAAYLALLENFKKLGYFEDYDACYYDYRRLHREQDWSGTYHPMHPAEEWARKRIDALLDVFYGYGKKPLWPLLWSAGTVLLFAVIWLISGINGRRGKNGRGIFERFGQQNATVKSERQGLLGGARAIPDSLLFSATVFLSGTRLFVEPPAQPEMRELSANQVKWAMIIERVLGALFSILFFLAISGTVVR